MKKRGSLTKFPLFLLKLKIEIKKGGIPFYLEGAEL